ncbi:MHS family MFS transporter [Streptomyces sp. NBC_00876]|uniref:MFS transporter n=1 Tax=Streptomyces sp. NBC_00876 TaxID=2975853 RepID=UPI003868E010|nr:MHS family MFS transporter [Streptomyces sp. NBC_00876]
MRQGTTPAPAGSAPALSTRRLASAQIIGTTIEWYDFFIYGTASALVFSHVFFPELPPLVGTLLSLATFGAGFLARPLGAVLFGHFGDRVGRKRTLVVTLLLMGGATVAVGLLPSYDAIGVASPLLLLLLRIVQGMAVGGEWGGAALIGIEHAAPRRKTLFGAFAQLGSPLGLVLATLVFMAVTAGSDAWLHSWGWRLPFLASVLLIPIGMAIRTKIHESPDFTAAHEAPKPARLPVVEVLRQDWRRVLIGVGAFAGVFVTYYLLTTFTLVYATGTLGMSTSITLPANLIAAVSEGLFVLIGALLAPRFGARRIALASAIGLVIWAWPAFALVGTQNAALLYLGVAVSMAFVGAGYGVLAAEVVLLFRPEVRYTGASLSYGIAGSIGGIAPSFSTYLLDRSGSTTPVAVLTGVVALGMAAACLALPRRGEGEVLPGTPRTDAAVSAH